MSAYLFFLFCSRFFTEMSECVSFTPRADESSPMWNTFPHTDCLLLDPFHSWSKSQFFLYVCVFVLFFETFFCWWWTLGSRAEHSLWVYSKLLSISQPKWVSANVQYFLISGSSLIKPALQEPDCLWGWWPGFPPKPNSSFSISFYTVQMFVNLRLSCND